VSRALYERLCDIKERCEQLVEDVHGDPGSVTGDRVLAKSVLYDLHVIGEACGALPEEFRARHSEVDWKGWKDFRNLTTHVYWRADAMIAAEAMAVRPDVDGGGPPGRTAASFAAVAKYYGAAVDICPSRRAKRKGGGGESARLQGPALVAATASGRPAGRRSPPSRIGEALERSPFLAPPAETAVGGVLTPRHTGERRVRPSPFASRHPNPRKRQ
jgi:uncharacterized protein with HEPN domain